MFNNKWCVRYLNDSGRRQIDATAAVGQERAQLREARPVHEQVLQIEIDILRSERQKKKITLVCVYVCVYILVHMRLIHVEVCA